MPYAFVGNSKTMFLLNINEFTLTKIMDYYENEHALKNKINFSKNKKLYEIFICEFVRPKHMKTFRPAERLARYEFNVDYI